MAVMSRPARHIAATACLCYCPVLTGRRGRHRGPMGLPWFLSGSRTGSGGSRGVDGSTGGGSAGGQASAGADGSHMLIRCVPLVSSVVVRWLELLNVSPFHPVQVSLVAIVRIVGVKWL